MEWVVGIVVVGLICVVIGTLSRKHKEPLLHQAARTGDLVALREAIKQNQDINSVGPYGTALDMAVLFMQKDIAVELLRCGADPKLLSFLRRYSVIHIASAMGLPDYVTVLLDEGVPVDILDGDGNTPLQIVSFATQVNIQAIVRREFPDQSFPKPQYCTTAEILLNHGADIMSRDANGVTPLMHAVSSAQEALVHLFAERGADIRAKEPGSESNLLLLAVDKNRYTIAHYLLDKGVPVNEPNLSAGVTALHIAAANGRLGLVKLLVQYGADLSARSNDGMTPLEVARNYGRKPAVVEFLRSEADKG